LKLKRRALKRVHGIIWKQANFTTQPILIILKPKGNFKVFFKILPAIKEKKIEWHRERLILFNFRAKCSKVEGKKPPARLKISL
jgi:hypothetical protein